ncbi:RecT family recombinase [Rheinheimera sp.]|uniref:RecT family recombinase n=1 Tax=Rheinheimera sp. TaxID=1869214 RepID=UPI003D2B086C
MNAATQLATQPENVVSAVNTISILTNPTAMNAMMHFAEVMSSGVSTVPKHLQGKPSDCLAIVMQAARWGMDPFAVGQKTHLVNGTLGYEAQLVNAVLMSSGAIRGRFHYEYSGDGNKLSCRAGAIPSGEAEIAWTEWLCIDQITTKNSPLWKTNPKQQMAYLQVKNWGRLYAPGAIMGIYSVEELYERDAEPRDINPSPESAATAAQPQHRTSGLASSLKARSAANQSVTVEPVAELVAGDDDALIIDDEPALSPEAQKYEAMLLDCTEAEHFADWQGQVKAKFAANSHDYIALVKSYKARRAQFSNAN